MLGAQGKIEGWNWKIKPVSKYVFYVDTLWIIKEKAIKPKSRTSFKAARNLSQRKNIWTICSQEQMVHGIIVTNTYGDSGFVDHK